MNWETDRLAHFRNPPSRPIQRSGSWFRTPRESPDTRVGAVHNVGARVAPGFDASAPPLIGPCCHGSDEQKVYRELWGIVAEWIAVLERDGKRLPAASAGREYGGKFVLRANPLLHKRLALKAMAEGERLSLLCAKALMGVG